MANLTVNPVSPHHSKPNLAGSVPEILAPAGGRAQFFAALHAGADAVYLGLKEFNARGRAENFGFDDLRELVPIARQQGMKVLVTLNILVKELELARLIDDLAQLQWLGIEAVIIQDLGVARLVRRYFPELRMHASTQMAIHNLEGVRAAAQLGFRRVVLARELTAQELRLIRKATLAEGIEIEAFCHGSLCYSYSGLCFFSGAEDARSGNRGECAYTCRKPYQVISEPGHGFLFSMKDLDTSKDLYKFVEAGIDTLKIEGRKKDAQYVATAVGLYRQELNQLYGRDTAPMGRSIVRDFRADMDYSFHRETTSFFVNGRYHENVIDLANPTHKGKKIGKVSRVNGHSIELTTEVAIERFDGLRVDRQQTSYHAKPQHGEQVHSSVADAQKLYDNEVCQFSLRDFTVAGRKATSCAAGDRVQIFVPKDLPLPKVGDAVYKTRSNELKRATEAISQAPHDVRLRAAYPIVITVSLQAEQDILHIILTATAANRLLPLATANLDVPAVIPEQISTLQRDLEEQLAVFGDAGFVAEVFVEGDTNFFVPRRQLKQVKQALAQQLPDALIRETKLSRQRALNGIADQKKSLAAKSKASYQIKLDRLETLRAVADYAKNNPDTTITEVVFEPKRAFLAQKPAQEILKEILSVTEAKGWQLRLALPTVLRAWDLPGLKPWITAYRELGGSCFELGNLGAWQLLKDMQVDLHLLDMASDFSLYALNSEAVAEFADLGIKLAALSIEDDGSNIRQKLQHWPNQPIEPQVILYKDTPLFIAEACSLTALHHGCPTAKVCGYRSLEITNDEGEKFFVAHETCKSIVYGADAFAITQHRNRLMEWGVAKFRIDFLTRPYDESTIASILAAAARPQQLAGTYPGNFERELI